MVFVIISSLSRVIIPLHLLVITYSVAAPEICVDGDVRLVDGADEREGRVEVCRSGIWGAVTDNLNITTGWTFNDAAVVCSQLRFNPLGESSSVYILHML